VQILLYYDVLLWTSVHREVRAYNRLVHDFISVFIDFLCRGYDLGVAQVVLLDRLALRCVWLYQVGGAWRVGSWVFYQTLDIVFFDYFLSLLETFQSHFDVLVRPSCLNLDRAHPSARIIWRHEGLGLVVIRVLDILKGLYIWDHGPFNDARRVPLRSEGVFLVFMFPFLNDLAWVCNRAVIAPVLLSDHLLLFKF
jgi:hypothetical protein